MTETYKIEVEGPTLMPTGKWAVLVTIEGSGTKVLECDDILEAKTVMDEISRDLESRAATPS